MKQLIINLNSIQDIAIFSQATLLVDEKLILKSDRYVVNAKSIMGIYSLNLLQPVIVEIEANEFPKSFIEKIKHIIVN